jgi:lipopolysaccharide heptosyltransferase I
MRILIVKLSAIGDVVHTLPAAAAIKSAIPDAIISWAVERKAAAILRDSPAIDEILEIDLRDWHKDWSSVISLRWLKQQLNPGLRLNSAGFGAQLFDIAIDFQGLIKSGIVSLASSAPHRIGFETADLRETASRLFLTHQVKTSNYSHVIQKNLALANQTISLAVPRRFPNQFADVFNHVSYKFPIAVSSSDEMYADEVTDSHEGRFAILNPGGAWSTKLWKPDSYGSLANWLNAEFGLRSIVTFGPGEEELADSVVSSAGPNVAFRVESTLKQFAALARRASIFVGGDSGPLHIAAASKTPIVGLFGPTSSQRNGPYDPCDVTVGRDLWCRDNCYRRRCWHWECMDIPLTVVQRAVVRRLASREAKIEVTMSPGTTSKIGH